MYNMNIITESDLGRYPSVWYKHMSILFRRLYINIPKYFFYLCNRDLNCFVHSYSSRIYISTYQNIYVSMRIVVF